MKKEQQRTSLASHRYGKGLAFLGLAFGLALSCLGLAGRPAAAQSDGVLGGVLYATGGPVSVKVEDAEAGYTSELWLKDPNGGDPTYLGTNREVGKVITLPAYPVGTPLVFYIVVEGPGAGNTFTMGDGTANPDGVPHAIVKVTGPGQALVSFEDLIYDPLSPVVPDYDDNVFSFTGVVHTIIEPPLPPTTTDTTPPTITTCSVTPGLLWPPNHKMVDITVAYSVTDNMDAAGDISCKLSVTSSEPDNGLGDGDTAGDIEIIDAHHVRLRAERSGKGTGRVYTITITCTDSSGNTSTKTCTVTVPHDMRGR
jgi:hypothetical protein